MRAIECSCRESAYRNGGEDGRESKEEKRVEKIENNANSVPREDVMLYSLLILHVRN